MKKFKAGDVIIHPFFKDAIIQIVKVYKKYYVWKYKNTPDGINNIFKSKDSNDPLFEMGWRNINPSINLWS